MNIPNTNKNAKPANKKPEVIFKANDLVQKMWSEMGLREQQIFALLVKQIRKYDKEFKVQKFTFAEIAKELRWAEGGNTRTCLMKALQNLGRICFWHRTPDNVKKIKLCRVLGSDATIDEEENTVEMKLDDTLMPYLIGLHDKGNKMITRFNYIIAANSQFTMPLYEFLRSKAITRFTWEEPLTVTEIKELLNIKPTQPWGNLKRDALDAAIKEINDITDMIVKTVPNKVGKRIDSVTFFCKRINLDEQETLENMRREAFGEMSDYEKGMACPHYMNDSEKEKSQK